MNTHTNCLFHKQKLKLDYSFLQDKNQYQYHNYFLNQKLIHYLIHILNHETIFYEFFLIHMWRWHRICSCSRLLQLFFF